MKRFLLPAILVITLQLPSFASEGQTVTHREAVERLARFGQREFVRGKALYNRVCASCHGSRTLAAPVPNSRRFHEAPMLNGADPYSLFRTLEYGYNQMVPQPWMDPVQKYLVIHYLREEFFREANPSQYIEITPDYLASIPEDATLTLPPDGWRSRPVPQNQYLMADYGPHLFGHFEAAPGNFAFKGLILPIDEPPAGGITRATHWALYDLDTLRLVTTWKGGFIDWNDLPYNGTHLVHAKITGTRTFLSTEQPAWAAPGGESFADPREEAVDTRFYGPLPKEHARYLGLSREGVLRYEVQGVQIEESLALLDGGVVQRTFSIAPHEQPIHHLAGPNQTPLRVIGAPALRPTPDGQVLTLEPSSEPQTVHLLLGASQSILDGIEEPASAGARDRQPDLRTVPSPIRSIESPLPTADIVVPQLTQNPWAAWIRPAGFDFLSDGTTAIVASWMGDVFRVENATGEPGESTTWMRIATGLHQPLGLKVVDNQIYVGARDQIVRLQDLDGDQITDFYECFNTDHQVSIHFHEFAAGLDTDSKGNFYYVKAGRHDKPALFPQHGAVVQVAADGSASKIVANGFRSSNGAFIDVDDTIWTTDQEGHWHPQNRINRTRRGKFYGNLLGHYDPWRVTTSDDAMEQPLVWVPKNFENSPSEVFRFPAEGWGPLNGQLAYLSYALGRLMLLPHESINARNATVQGATFPLPIPDFPTGLMRARPHPETHDLFVCGLFGWGSQRVQDGGFYRLRFEGAPLHVPVGFNARPGELELRLSDPVSRETADAGRFEARTYTIWRSRRYGSKLENETRLEIDDVRLSEDGRVLTLGIPDLAPTRILDLQFQLLTSDGKTLDRHLSATIHQLD